jgi:hypothetical protein
MLEKRPLEMAVRMFDRLIANWVSSERRVAACQFLQSSDALASEIDRLELVPTGQFGQFARVVAMISILASETAHRGNYRRAYSAFVPSTFDSAVPAWR